MYSPNQEKEGAPCSTIEEVVVPIGGTKLVPKRVTIKEFNHGNIERSQVKDLLTASGSYLVRNSSIEGFHVISIKKEKDIFHLLFKVEDGKIQMYSSNQEKEGAPCSTIEEVAVTIGGTDPVFKSLGAL